MILQMTLRKHIDLSNIQASNFFDFIKQVNQKYDRSIKQIFLVLDNKTIHKSNKVKENQTR